jgi:hypothetical protein
MSFEWNDIDVSCEREGFALNKAPRSFTPRHGKRGSLPKLYRERKKSRNKILAELNVIDGKIYAGIPFQTLAFDEQTLS